MRRATAALLAVLLAADAPAQQPPETPVFGADVEMVAVDVAVVDANGRPIRDLTAQEFQVEIDGKPRQVVSADFFALGEDTAAPEPPPVTHGFSTNQGQVAGRAVILAFDTGSMPPGGGRGAVKAADALLDRLSPADRVGLVTIPARGGPQVDLTADHTTVRNALGSVVGRGRAMTVNRRLSVNEALAAEAGTPEWDDALERECPEDGGAAGNGPGRQQFSERDVCISGLQEEAFQLANGVRQHSRDSISTLRALFRALQRIEGRKTLVLLTGGMYTETGHDIDELGREAGAAGLTVYVLRVPDGAMDASSNRSTRTDPRDEFVLGEGVDRLAAATNGTTFRVVSDGQKIYERLAQELSGYYLLGFAPEPGDRDGKVHVIKAKVTRPGATVRTRRALSIPASTLDAQRQKDLIASALQSPIPAVEIPMRVTTWALPAEGGKVRVLIGGDLGAPGSSARGMTVGWVLLNGKGKVVTSSVQRAEQEAGAVPGVRGVPFFGSAVVEPALYTLKLAAVDGRGRRGTVEHAVSGALTTGGGLSAGDLLLSPPAAAAGQGLKPALEVDASRGIVGWMEVGGATGDVTGVAEVAAKENGPALLSVPAKVGSPAPGRKALEAAVGTHLLPPGDYVLRMVVKHGSRNALSVSRPFRMDAAPTVAGAPFIGAEDVRTLLRFRRQDVLGAEVAQPLVAAAPPAAAQPLRQGIDHLNRNALPQALQAFRTASKVAPGHAAGVFLTGVTLAADGRDREAIGAWQVARTKGLPTAGAYAALADALLRTGDVKGAEDALGEGLGKYPADPRLERSRAIAAAIAGRRAEARPLLLAAVQRDPGDVELRFVLVRLLLEETRTGGADGAREELIRQAAAYVDARGQHATLVTAWLESLQDAH